MPGLKETILEFSHVYFSWGEGLEIRNFNKKIEKGEFVLINGPSGSGKSTVLRLAAKLEEPVTGEILFHGKPYASISPERLRKKVALIQQTPTVLEGSVKENLLLPFCFRINKEENIPEEAYLKKRLEELYLNVSLDKEASSLSVGQKQRLCILRTLLLRPEVLLMDEPTSALDPESGALVENISEKLNEEGVTIIMISHSQYRSSRPFTLWKMREGKAEVSQ